jgi:hypothetical protein
MKMSYCLEGVDDPLNKPALDHDGLWLAVERKLLERTQGVLPEVGVGFFLDEEGDEELDDAGVFDEVGGAGAFGCEDVDETDGVLDDSIAGQRKGLLLVRMGDERLE